MPAASPGAGGSGSDDVGQRKAMWRDQDGSGAGKSRRVWTPRDSSRAEAEAAKIEAAKAKRAAAALAAKK